MEPIDFSQPARQSPKGILVIFALNTFKFIRRYFVLFLALGLSLSKKESLSFLNATNLTLIILGVFLLIFVVAFLKYLNFKFHLDEGHFYLSSGIVNKDMTIIPKSKIQNINIKQNLIQQMINVVSLTIETAGDDKAEIEINALSRITALDLKKQLFVKKQITDFEFVEKPFQSSVFFKASVQRLLLEGISQNHIRSFLIIFSFVFGLYKEFENYLQDLGITHRLQSAVNFETDSILNLILANVFIVVLAILGSMLFSIMSTFISNFNLEVVENEDTIEINKGLFNKLSLILVPLKIQNIIIKTNRLKQYFGLHTLSIKQAMINKKQQRNFNIVALEKHQVAHLVQKVFVNYNDKGAYEKPDIYYKRLLMFRSLISGAFINIPAYFIFGNYFWLINIIIISWITLFVHFTFKKASYQITDEYLTVNSGFIDRVRNISELHKIQSVELKQSIFQKRKNIASIYIATASDKVKIPYITEEKAQSILDFLLFKIES
ncbi:PH domain-containing protein [Gelidibacter sp.]|uniref:PH domain-containing protein n=1 Tax=Gelidibacter sp. TaxID=2018083 RepID=UPI002D07BA27|nr:PH domain-containing protein [Gelidibacter sp.]HUH27354.1 PH domain-containing protein [Gelidibacter sp.]